MFSHGDAVRADREALGGGAAKLNAEAVAQFSGGSGRGLARSRG